MRLLGVATCVRACICGFSAQCYPVLGCYYLALVGSEWGVVDAERYHLAVLPFSLGAGWQAINCADKSCEKSHDGLSR